MNLTSSVCPYISPQERQAREELAACYHLVDYFGWSDLIYTHISLRLPDAPDHFLLNEFGLCYSEITPDNLVKVDVDGRVLDRPGADINLAGYVVHSAIHQARPEINCIIHTHSLAGMALSALECGLLPITQHACHLYNTVAYHDYEGIVFDLEEQPRLVRDLGDKNVLILRNHGFLTAGRTIPEAFALLYFLEKAAEAQLKAQSTGQPLVIPPPDVCEKVARQFQRENPVGQRLWTALLRLLP